MEHFLSTADARTERARYIKAAADSAVVLIVEHEALVRMNTVQMVEDAGYTALEAANADDAVAILKERADVRAVFTDVKMSGSMCGLELAQTARKRWPLIHLIVTSGLPIGSELPTGARFLRKPYENSRVVGLLHELFDAAK
jgi:two-component system, response regulator PdtaR